jgi:hypothetical protein
MEESECPGIQARTSTGIQFIPAKFSLGRFAIDGSDWTSLGESYMRMLDGAFELDDTQAEFVSEFAVNAETPVPAVESLIRELAERTRYVAVEIGIGGWQPTPAAECFELGYGDCKDLSTLHVAMIRGLSRTANLALVRTKDLGPLDPAHPELGWFNHVIYYIPGAADTLWHDPTCTDCPPGDLPWADEDIWVLAIDSADSRLVHTPPSTAQDNRIARTAKMHLGTNGRTTASISLSAHGNPSHSLRAVLREGAQAERFSLARSSVFDLPAAISISGEILADEDDARLRFDAEMSPLVNSGRDRNYIPCSLFPVRTLPEHVDTTACSGPIHWPDARSWVDSVLYVLPRGYRLADGQGPTEYRDSFGELSIDFETRGDTLIIERRRSRERARIEHDDIPYYLRHLDILDSAGNRYLTLIRD